MPNKPQEPTPGVSHGPCDGTARAFLGNGSAAVRYAAKRGH